MFTLIRVIPAITAALLLPAIAKAAAPPASVSDLQVQPASLVLTHPNQPHSLLVSGRSTDGLSLDLTAQAAYRTSNDKVAKVDVLGWVQPVASGDADITVTAAGKSAVVKVRVQLPAKTPGYSFRNDIMPVLSKGGCNQGACHGYSLGKNGFKLSLRGSDPADDYQALTDEFLERRINRHNPPASLLVTKPLGDVPHEGGVRFERGGLLHQSLLGWIRDGAKSDVDDPVKLVSIDIYPKKIVLAPGMQHPLQLLARYSDGHVRDVTRLGIYTVNTERVAAVDDAGLVNARELGETAVSARFERIFATANFIVLKTNPNFKPTPIPQDNLIDTHVVRKLNDLKIRPSDLADDAVFLRRVYVDLIGVQPTADEVLTFLNDKAPDKRAKAIDALFRRPEFVDQWSLKWGDLLQNSRKHLSEPAVYALREWLRSAVARNMPLDEFARRLLTSRGGVSDDPASAYYAVSKDADDSLQRATQVFCGVRMLCARCHAHPFENWTQADYYGLHSFFNQVTAKADPRLTNVPRARAMLVNKSAGYSLNTRSRKVQKPRFLGGQEVELLKVDRREAYAKWLTSPDNPFFARSLVNRYWSYFFHRGIIDPVDDIRTTNPPINPELLDALTKDFIAHKFDVRQLMRTIVTSRTYQRSSVPNETNAADDMNFSRMVPRRLPAEVLLDSLGQATGVLERFGGAPAGFSAKQLPDAEVKNDVLNLFGKPQRVEACECERDDGSNMLQALQFINGDTIMNRVNAGNGRLAALLKQKMSDDRLIEQLYLWTLCRRPSDKERQVSLKVFQTYGQAKRTDAAQDLMWALLNSKDFLLVN
ncbi:MAG TPA: DUF1549 and DUF1553 domain-containing protein [Gemmataceae bacterium]|nr:DUF1549 and DUF1553 domain-containing protein [Gemmataceae bacterium]